ncbi:MAG: hypothetical protein U0228_03570 [Myxococcaceae bacterium]
MRSHPMVVAATLSVALGASSPVVAAPAPAADVASAKKGLESARSKLAEALKKVEAEAPTLADLDAAHATLEDLKDAIDAGAGQEANDLDYAKAALAARKDLREKRDFVDARRSKLKIFNHRRTIDEKLATVKDLGKQVEAKEVPSKTFDDVRAAIAELRKATTEAKPFGPQDAAFQSYLNDTEATAAKIEKASDDKWAAQEGDKHRAKVEEARIAFNAKMVSLTTASTDAEFGDADTAGKLLAQRLDEGKPLEAKDKNYGAYATKTRGELTAAKKKSDELWSQTGFTRLKAEIEPTAKDLAGAVKIVHMRAPSADQLAEAKTIAIVARKTLEKFDAEAQRSQQFGAYVETVRAQLTEVEAQLAIKALDLATRDLRTALQKLDKKAPSDDDFAVANSALLVLDKTLEPLNAKDPNLVQPVADAKAWQKEGKTTITKRRIELDVAAQKAKVEDARKMANTIIGNFSKPDSGPEAVQEAETAINAITAALNGGTELIAKDREYAFYDGEVKKRITELQGKIATRKLQLEAIATKNALVQSLADAKAKIEAARAPAGTDADLDAATKALDAINTSLEAKAPLEMQAGSYAAAAEKARYELVKRYEGLELARVERDVRKKTADAYAPALLAFDTAAASNDLRVQKTNYEKALTGFKSCKEEGAKALEQNPAWGRLAVVINGTPSTVKEVVSGCTAKTDVTAPLIKPIAGLIAFDDGPKKAYEAAVALLGKGKKTEALAQFDECTATAVTLGVRNPELKERVFTVAGNPMTLSELSKACTAKSRELLGKK